MSKYTLAKNKCCYSYIPKTLRNEINKLKKELQQEENKKKGKKALTVTFTYAGAEYVKKKRGRKWF